MAYAARRRTSYQVDGEFSHRRWMLDPGFEMQGGVQLTLLPSLRQMSATGGVRATVQLADERLNNGSALWNTRAGMRYQDVWTFPPNPSASQRRAEHHEAAPVAALADRGAFPAHGLVQDGGQGEALPLRPSGR